MDGKLRISYFNYHYDIDGAALGAATQVRDLAAALTRLGHRVDLQFRTARPAGEPSREYLGLKQIRWLRRFGHIPRLISRNLPLMREECRLLDNFEPDVVLAVSSYCNISALAAARSRGVPFVLFAEAPMEYEYSLFYPHYHRYPRVGRWLEGINVCQAQEVVCISEVLKGYLMRYGVPALKLQVIPNGVDHRAFAPGDPDEGLKERLALQHRVVIGYIGSFEFFAGVPGFVAMAQAICKADRRVVFLLVGDGQARLEIQGRAAALGLTEHFRFIGRVPHDQVPAYLRVMDIVVSPYRHEYLFYNSPMKLLEYMAMGKATVSTALGQIKEVVADGENGMLYEPGNYDSMGARLLELVRNPKLRQQLGLKARKTIERNWTWDLQAARLTRVLQQARSAWSA